VVGIVLISHSAGLAEGAAELAAQIPAAYGSFPPTAPTTAGWVPAPNESPRRSTPADTGDGVLLLPDLGSSVLSALSVLADLDPQHGSKRIRLADAPFVEGAVAAAVAASGGLDLAAVATAAEEARDARKL
jgi:dihydroxyacetone kinase DhaKLM complex PTS-EIIA-like component DhaM